MENTHENLGPAERIIQTLVTYSDHMVHNRPGMIVQDARTTIGVRWEPVTTVVEGDTTTVFKLLKGAKPEEVTQGEKKIRIRGVRVGQLWKDNTIRVERRKVADFRPAGIYPEVARWIYSQIAEVWKLDNEFAAKWASYAFGQDHKDLRVALAAFMLVQSRKGDPVLENGAVLFHDDDFRDVGEAMCLITKGRFLNAKELLRVHRLLVLPQIAELNRELGFGRSARHPTLGRWPKAVEKWLRYRENNPQMLEGLVKSGFKSSVIKLARLVRYKPQSPTFFKTLGWEQTQATDGRRTLAIGQEWEKAETWEGQTEEQICQRIVGTKPSWKVIVGRVPVSVGITRAIMAAAIEANALSDKDLIIATPTLEELGLLKVQDIRERWELALRSAEDQRAANIARNVKNKDTQEKLQGAADTAVQKAVEEVARDLRVYVLVDISSSMDTAIEKAKTYLEKFLQGFKPEQLHVCVFNTAPREVTIRHASAAGVQQAFRGIASGGATDYGSTVHFCRQHPPKEGEDSIYIYVGDEDTRPRTHVVASTFGNSLKAYGLNPLSFGLIRVLPTTPDFHGQPWVLGTVVQRTAAELGIPCFQITEETFQDAYAIPRTIRNLIAATPVGKPVAGAPAPRRLTLVDTILETKLLQKPNWAA